MEVQGGRDMRKHILRIMTLAIGAMLLTPVMSFAVFPMTPGVGVIRNDSSFFVPRVHVFPNERLFFPQARFIPNERFFFPQARFIPNERFIIPKARFVPNERFFFSRER